MRMPSDSPLLTAEDVFGLSIPDKRVELVRGRLIVREPPNVDHGTVQARLCHCLLSWVEPCRLGLVVGEAGFKIETGPDTVRGPDVAFVSQPRVAEIPRRGFPTFAPELVVEIVSPNDRPGEVLAKVADWLEAGTGLVWVIDPQRREARIHRGDGSLSVVEMDGALDGEDVLPGFLITLADVLR